MDLLLKEIINKSIPILVDQKENSQCNKNTESIQGTLSSLSLQIGNHCKATSPKNSNNNQLSYTAITQAKKIPENNEIIQNTDFNIDDLLQKLLVKIRANHPSIRSLIVSWITFLDSIPQIKLINKIYEFLPGLFNMLCDKSKDVNQSADKCLRNFLFEIDNVFEKLDKETTNRIIEIIVDQCKMIQDLAKQSAFDWLLKFLKKYNSLLNKLCFQNISFQNKYFGKLVNNKDRFSNIISIKRNIHLNDNKKFTKSFTEAISNSPSNNLNEKVFSFEDTNPTKRNLRQSDECVRNKTSLKPCDNLSEDKFDLDTLIQNSSSRVNLSSIFLILSKKSKKLIM